MHRTVYLKTTETCNLNCKHCFTNGINGKKIFWNHNEIVNWITKLNATLKITDSVHFELHGGEPFLAPLETLEYVVEQSKKLNNNFTFAAATNLVYKLTDDIRFFIRDKLDNGISTSWDPDIRFKNNKQENLWLSNLKTLISDGINVTLNISISTSVINLDIEKLLIWIKSLGIQDLSFERITSHGNASNNNSIVPNNRDVDNWYLRLHEASEKLGARKWFNNTLLEEVYVKFEKRISNSGTFYRACEERLFTINADGTIAGCPNSAPDSIYGNIKDSISSLLTSPGRIETMAKEKMRNELCLSCNVFEFCGSGCYQLQWDGYICPSPKTLMQKLANITIENNSDIKKKKTIYIQEVK